MIKKQLGDRDKSPRHSAAGKRLIAALDEVVAHVEGKIALPVRYIEMPEAAWQRYPKPRA